jgi:putative salt-induced outer membrane protein YdiY
MVVLFSADKTMTILWPDVVSIKTARPRLFALNDGTEIQSLAISSAEGSADLKSDAMSQPTAVSLASITGIDAPPPKLVTYRGILGAGASVSDGNTRNRTFNLLGEFEVRTEKFRFNIRGAYNYAEDEDSLTQRNGRIQSKFDYFLTKRFYLFASTLFENDAFQDLKLRTALAAGPGYQFIDKGDFKEEWLKEMQLSAEVGISYFNEDFDEGADQTYVAARWALKFEWPFLPKQISFFHYNEGYPSLERSDDIYILTETGLRFKIWGNFIATLQVNWRWDNTPTDDNRRSDTLYIATLGYSFEI